MSFVGPYKKLIDDGDTVIAYVSVQSMYALSIKRGGIFQTKYGALYHDAIIGKPYGIRVRCGKPTKPGGFIHVLHPTPELWSLTLPHRTQIIYTRDISAITFELALRPGSIVCEAGTGSGSLSHAILRTIAPNGHLYTYDFHEGRVQKAREEFHDHGLADLVTIQHCDVVADGFIGVTHLADAVFLDLPNCWDVISHLRKALKTNGGRFCAFTPCIEQAQKMCIALDKEKFDDIKTIECLLQRYDAMYYSVPVLGNPKGTTEMDDYFNLRKGDFGERARKEKDETDCKKAVSEASPPKEETNPSETEPMQVEEAKCEPSTSKGEKRQKRSLRKMKHCDAEAAYHAEFNTAQAPFKMLGHSGYLTFATLRIDPVSKNGMNQEESVSPESADSKGKEA